METRIEDSRFRRDTLRLTYRGYLLSATEDGRVAVEGGTEFIGDYPSVGTARRAIDYREAN